MRWRPTPSKYHLGCQLQDHPRTFQGGTSGATVCDGFGMILLPWHMWSTVPQGTPPWWYSPLPPVSPKTAKDIAKGVWTEPKVHKRGHPKNNAENNAEKKKRKVCEKCSQNDTKLEAEMDEISMRFRNLRFLCFCRGYNVKIFFFYMTRGTYRPKNDGKTMQKSGWNK